MADAERSCGRHVIQMSIRDGNISTSTTKAPAAQATGAFCCRSGWVRSNSGPAHNYPNCLR